MDRTSFLALSEGEALHFDSDHSIPWDAPEAARSENELAHILQYRWFRHAMEATGRRGRHLDVACGTGYGTAHLAASPAVKESVGVDLNARHLEAARADYSAISFLSGDCEKLPGMFEDRSFTFVTSGQTIEHLIDPVGFVDGVRRILTHDGLFLLMSPTHDTGLRALERRNPFHVVEYDPAHLGELLDFFFEDVRMGSSLPERQILDIFGSVVPGAKVPEADAVYCTAPRQSLDAAAVAAFRSDFLLRLYGAIVRNVQERMVQERRAAHFLRDTYHLIDFVSGVFPSEVDKIWCMPQADLVLRPSAPGRSIVLKLVLPASETFPMTARTVWDGGEQLHEARDRRATPVTVGPLAGPTPVRLETAPPFVARDHGLTDLRTLGCCISGVADTA